MSERDTDNLTGVWSGLFNQPDIGQSVTFTATLIEAGNSITGSTHEPCIMLGCPRRTHLATLSGQRAGRVVTFVKTYDPPGFGYGTVAYDGSLNSDATEISGRWTIPHSSWSGDFLMIRVPKRAAARAREKTANV